MLSLVVPIVFTMVAVAMALNLWRLVKGPAMADRILALDTLTINTIALVLLLDMALQTTVFFEAALVLATMGFVGTVALAKFVLGGDIIE
ncbi:K+/H+ antiporter subunit F [Polymorphobacter sp.]|uniref:K+/H+ antiporter subunit F n=1 Tax=Polymorphobacter sp. TaxID=1909290 RepID=UPI003F6F1603